MKPSLLVLISRFHAHCSTVHIDSAAHTGEPVYGNAAFCSSTHIGISAPLGGDSRYSYRLGDAHDSVDGQTVHLLSLHTVSKQLQHGRLVPQLGHLLNHSVPDACKGKEKC